MTSLENEFHNIKKEHFSYKLDEYSQKIKRGDQFLKNERYLIKIEVEGCPFLGHDSVVEPKEIMTTATLEELPQYLRFINEPYWEHPSLNWVNQRDEEFCDNVPFEEKKWGIYKSVRILERIRGAN